MKRKAILVVSFGTSHNDTRQKTIDQIEMDIQQEYLEYAIYRAFTSKMIINILGSRDGIHVFTMTEAMEQMKLDGIEEVIVQPTHILNGIENDIMIHDVNLYKEDFNVILFGAPLLNVTEDYKKVIKAFVKKIPALSQNEAIVCMGHGSEHYTNASYAALDYMFKSQGYDNIYVATVEAYPSLEDIIEKLRENKYRKIILIPFMIVAGDHAKNDMAGDEDDSWKVILESEGFEVTCVLEGLGENSDIRRIFVEHINEVLTSE
ncbi:sirohydrochlorin cobaltochelatase [Lachnoclostridium phytofermentans]|uniref:Anaerobic cobalt chelatase n=1 Tax=Lachnoclostridium phytofermentans (strain ATCC 700394 / DSM 18823 / ISDg) TaxID=357809 RepID=A9KPA0_LACP7|nr:sirohydrochlorin cobaltochelatase [Lachnoclostridium phytofermentans]ABX41762.1 anaerobic cobalt chelatase [Lachnoclostridium phytofermentans ISDg]